MRKLVALLLWLSPLLLNAQIGTPSRNDLPVSSPEVQTYVAATNGDVQEKLTGNMSVANAGVVTDATSALFRPGDVGKNFAISLAPGHAPTLIAPTVTSVSTSIAGPAEFHFKEWCTNTAGTQRGDESFESAKFLPNSSNQVVITGPSTCDNGLDHYVVSVSVDSATDWPGRTSGKEINATGLSGCGNGAPLPIASSCTLNSVPTYTIWSSTHTFGAAAQVIDSNGNLEWTSAGGTSGGSQPTWNATISGTVSDGTVTWKNLGPITVQYDFWKVRHIFAGNRIIKDSNGNLQVATTPGTSGDVVPTWNTTLLGTTTDGTAIWTLVSTTPTVPFTQWAFGTITAYTSATQVSVSLTCAPAGPDCPGGSLPSWALANNTYGWGTDDTANFQLACNAIVNTDGGTLIVPPGSYWINDTGVLCGNSGKKNFITINGTGGAGTPLIGIPATANRAGVSEFVQFGAGNNSMFTFGVGGATQTFGGVHLRDLAFRDGTTSTRAGGSAGGSLGSNAVLLLNETDFVFEDLTFMNWTHGIAMHFNAGQPGQWSQEAWLHNIRATNVEYVQLWDNGRTSNIKMEGIAGISSQLGGGICFDFESGGGSPTYFGGGGNDRIYGSECNYFPLSIHQTDLNVMDWTAFHAEQTATLEPNMIGSNNTGTGILIEGTVAGGGKCLSNKWYEGSVTGFNAAFQIGISLTQNQYCQSTDIAGLSNANNTTNILDFSQFTNNVGTPQGGQDTQISNDVLLQRQRAQLGCVNGQCYASAFGSPPGTYTDANITNAIAYMSTLFGGSNVLHIDGGHNYAIANQITIGNCTTPLPISAIVDPGSLLTINVTGGADAILLGDGSSIGGVNGQTSSTSANRPARIFLGSAPVIGWLINSCHNDGTQSGFGVHDLQISGSAGATVTGGIKYQGVGKQSYGRNLSFFGFAGTPLMAQGAVSASTVTTSGISWENISIQAATTGTTTPVQVLATNAGGGNLNNGVSDLSIEGMSISGGSTGVCALTITGNSAAANQSIANENFTLRGLDISSPNAANSGVCITDSHDIKIDSLTCNNNNLPGVDCLSVNNVLNVSANIQLNNGSQQGWTNLANDKVKTLPVTSAHIDHWSYGGTPTFFGPPTYLCTGNCNANLPTLPDGAQINIPDGVPNSNPCQPNGTGALGVHQNGAWSCQSSGTFWRVVNGTSALGTSAITAGTCATVVTTAATGTLTTDAINWSFNGAPPAAYNVLTVKAYPTVNNVNFLVCNPSAGSATPSAATLNWNVMR